MYLCERRAKWHKSTSSTHVSLSELLQGSVAIEKNEDTEQPCVGESTASPLKRICTRAVSSTASEHVTNTCVTNAKSSQNNSITMTEMCGAAVTKVRFDKSAVY